VKNILVGYLSSCEREKLEKILNKLLVEENIKRARERYVRYLAAYKVVEGNLALFDKMARCRDLSEFLTAVYESTRVKDRVLRKLEEGVREGDYKITFEIEGPISSVFNVGQDDLEKLISLAKDNPRIVGSFLATLALAYGGIQVVR